MLSSSAPNSLQGDNASAARFAINKGDAYPGSSAESVGPLSFLHSGVSSEQTSCIMRSE